MTDARLRSLGWSDRWAELLEPFSGEGQPGRVIRHDGGAVLVALENDDRHVPLRPALPPLAVGDWLVVDGQRAVALLERTSLLRRRDPTTQLEQPVAANVDGVLVVCGLDRPPKPGRIRRAMTQAWDAGATPLVVFTKADLVSADEAQQAAAAVDPGLEVLIVSATGRTGLRDLRETIVGRTTVLVGESGAGKSTLVNALIGDDVAATAAVRPGDAKGRHTTTARHLHVLPAGGCVIDTPGIRELGVWAGAADVDEAFDGIAMLAAGCRFNDCRHDGEPDCAVLAAVEAGELSTGELAAWRSLRREAEAAELRADEHARRREGRRFARIAREAQRDKGNDRRA